MTKQEAIRQTRQEDTLRALGFTIDEARALRRISMTLQRWYELECGDGNDRGSWAIERDDNGDGKPFMVHHHYLHGRGKDYTTRTPIADRERGAEKRLKAIIAARNDRARTATVTAARDAGALSTAADHAANTISAYLQTDPRGAALYIIRPGDVPDGADVSSYYTRGICVY
jgi:hypothetical protein